MPDAGDDTVAGEGGAHFFRIIRVLHLSSPKTVVRVLRNPLFELCPVWALPGETGGMEDG
jgi:hypothetical protein